MLKKPDISNEDVLKLAMIHFGASGSIQKFSSEAEATYGITDASGTTKLFKIADGDTDPNIINLQIATLEHINKTQSKAPLLSNLLSHLNVPQIIPNLNGEPLSKVKFTNNEHYYLRMLSFLPGTLMSQCDKPQEALYDSLGRQLGLLNLALANFEHPAAIRDMPWDLANTLQIENKLEYLASNERREDVHIIMEAFKSVCLCAWEDLPKSIIHNDANDNNILLDASELKVSGLIDFGDIVKSATICELATACCYAMMNQELPMQVARSVVAAYHAVRPLSSLEIEVLFTLIKSRLAISVCMSAYQSAFQPDNPYLLISEAPAWDLIAKLKTVHSRFALYLFRDACRCSAHPQEIEFKNFCSKNKDNFVNICQFDLKQAPLQIFDWEDDGSNLTELGNTELAPGIDVGIGRYCEARNVYRGEQFRTSIPAETRTIHLGLDLFFDAGNSIRAPFKSTVYAFSNNDKRYDYGPVILLEHQSEDLVFWTLYGHLSLSSLDNLKVGQTIEAGEIFAKIGSEDVNGGWPPHLHFQVILDLFELDCNFPGVVASMEVDLWRSISPNPNFMLDIPYPVDVIPRRDVDTLKRKRRQSLNPGLSLSYTQPVKIVRGLGAYLFDEAGQQYLDMVNNVCHVGHCHPHVIDAASRQMSMLNTNTRYLHDNIVEYAEHLAALFDDSLSVCFFTNSGSEANDLALRIASAHTKQKGIMVLDHAYHGNLQSLIELSPYKCEQTGGEGLAKHVRKLHLADPYRGIYRGQGATPYISEANICAEALSASEFGLSAFLAESISGCGGQVIHEPGFLAKSVEQVQAMGGVCILDEVQVGFGRVGSHWWAFEQQGVMPDIVTLGKPAGNGHPLGAVIVKKEIAASFNTGMEYFNTFGGNPVSCAIGLAVLDVIETENLRQNASDIGQYLIEQLSHLQQNHSCIGHIRGQGLFIGIDIIKNEESRTPYANMAKSLVEFAKNHGVLLSTDGPNNNVIKIKPPMVFSRSDADLFLDVMKTGLAQ